MRSALAQAVDLIFIEPEDNPYLYDPVAWVEDRLAEEMWSGQMDLMDAVADHRHVAAQSSHSIGKSWGASRLTAWWLDAHPPGDAFVVTTAPTQTQVEAVLWREIGRAHSRGGLNGRITYGQIPMWKFGNEIVAYGRKPAAKVDIEEAMSSFQGIHARFILVILDEASGIPKWLWDAAEALATNEDSRILAIGNPDDPSSYFEKICRPGSGWYKLKISAFDTPAFTGEPVSDKLLQVLVSPTWVEERRQRWGENSPLFVSKVLAEFPEVSEETLIYPSWVRQAQLNDFSSAAIKDPGIFGLDVARTGNNETACYRNRAGMIRLEWAAHKQDTMATAGKVVVSLNETKGYAPVHVDTIGVGGGVYDRLREQGFPAVAFVASEKPTTPAAQKRFANRRAEQWWAFREGLEDGLYDLPPDGEDDELISQLLSIKYKIRSDGRIIIESKEDMEKRGLPSPDRGDAAMQSTCSGGSVHIPKARRTDSRDVDEASLTGDLLEKKW